jgi:hypothetical protein
MPVHSLIFRFDFAKVNFSIIDSHGRIMSILDKAPNDTFSDYREMLQPRKVQGIYKSDNGDTARILTTEPTSLNVLLESAKGYELSSLRQDQTFNDILKVTSTIFDEFHINEIKRFGFRIKYFDKITPEHDQAFKLFSNVYSKHIVNAIDKALGSITDYMIAFNGSDKDSVNYHIKFGPYSIEDRTIYLSELKDTKTILKDYNLIYDIDLFEEDFQRPKVTLIKYLQAYTNKSIDVIKKANDALIEIERGI